MNSRIGVRVLTTVIALLFVTTLLFVPGFAHAQASASVSLGTNVYKIPTTEKVCALTFDDALNPTYVRRVLATLEATGDTATFFPTGSSIAGNPELVKQIVQAGCDIGSHTYTHAWMTKLTTSAMLSQIQKTEAALSAIGINDSSPLFRAPYGAWNSKLLSVLGGQGYVNVMWSSTAGDTAPGGVTASQAIRNVLSHLEPGAIILMHITHKSTPDALPELIRQIKARGYRIVDLQDALFGTQAGLNRYQQQCPQLKYIGAWYEYSSQSESGGSLRKGIGRGSGVVVSFTGTTFEWMACKGPDYGKAAVCIDGGTPATVDLYSSSVTYRNKVYRVTGLSNTRHTAFVYSTYSKNYASTGYNINVDAFKISGWLGNSPSPTVHQETDALFSYTGPWKDSWTGSASGGRLKYSDLTGAAVNIAFNGCYLSWTGEKGPDRGKALVVVDGYPITVDLYSGSRQYKARIFETGFLPYGSHTVTIYSLGEKRSASSGCRVNVDTIDLYGTPMAAPPPPARLLRYQQTDPRLTYLGYWSTSGAESASGGSYASTSHAGAAVMAKFTGSAVTVISRKTPWYGEAAVSLDGEKETLIDLWSPYAQWGVPIYAATGLSAGEHTLRIRCTGVKRAESLAASIGVDAFDIVGFMEQADLPTRYQESDTHLAFTPGWEPVTGDWSCSGGDYSSIDEAGSVRIGFEGTYLEWRSRMTPWYGKVKVVLDGDLSSAEVIDLYYWYVHSKQRVYSTGLVDDGPHTVDIYWLGEKNPSSLGTRIGLDSFDLFGVPAAADVAPAIELNYQDDDPRLTYLGDWSTITAGAASGGSIHSTEQPGAAMLAEFEGTTLTLRARTSPWAGEITVSLDGGPAETVDLYTAEATYQKALRAWTGLSSGTHTLIVRASGDKNPLSGGYAVNVDSLGITGTLSQAQTLVRYQEDDSHLVYTGDWIASPIDYWSYSGGAYVSTDQEGARVTVNFDGTYLAWSSKLAPWYGIADVSLDGDEPVEVDLYAASTNYKQWVYNTGLLPDGPHTLVIEYTGTMRDGAWGATIAADAFDVMGTL